MNRAAENETQHDIGLEALDVSIINELQNGLPISIRPYADMARKLGTSEDELLLRLQRLLQDRVLSRFGPMYDAEKLGGAFSLVAMQVPEHRYEEVCELVNAYPQVAHNYRREHAFNMWFVLATESREEIDTINHEIEQRSGLKVFNLPKQHEFYVGLKLDI
ncbi:AsnC family transcriptional regulator [Kaarinaea lacus]